jgi:glutamyl-tRNA synthetase
MFYVRPRPIPLDEKAGKQLTAEARACLGELAPDLAKTDWAPAALEATVRGFAEARGLKLGQIAQPLRAALTGSSISPGIFEVMAVLGQAEALGRITDSALPGR